MVRRVRRAKRVSTATSGARVRTATSQTTVRAAGVDSSPHRTHSSGDSLHRTHRTYSSGVVKSRRTVHHLRVQQGSGVGLEKR